MADFAVQRGTLTIPLGTTSTTVSITAVGSLSSALERVVAVHCGGREADKYQGDQSVTIELTATDTLTFTTPTGRHGTMTVEWEVIEYTGASGGPHEFIVRHRGVETFTATTKTITLNSTIGTLADAVPFVTAWKQGDTSNPYGYWRRFFSEWQLDSTTQATGTIYEIGYSPTTSLVVVEFTGSSWSVQSATGDTVTSGKRTTVTLGSSVSSWSNAWIVCSWSTDWDNDLDGSFLCYYPGSATNQVTLYTEDYARPRHYTLFVIENADLSVEHDNSPDGTLTGAGATIETVTYTIGSVTTSEAALFVSGITNSIYSDPPYGAWTAKIASSTSVTFTRPNHNNESTEFAYQVLDFSGMGGVTHNAAATPSAAVALDATGSNIKSGASSPGATASVDATGSAIVAGVSDLAVAAAVSATGKTLISGVASIGAAASFAASAVLTLGGNASIGATVAVSAKGTEIEALAANLAAAVSLAASGSAVLAGNAAPGADVAVSATASSFVNAASSLSAAVAVSATESLIRNATSSFSAAVSFAAKGTEIEAAAASLAAAVALVGDSAVDNKAAADAGVSVSFVASSAITFNGAASLAVTVTASVAGSFDIQAAVAAAVAVDVTPLGTLFRPANATADVAFTASVSGKPTCIFGGASAINPSVAFGGSGTTDPIVVIPLIVDDMIERIRTYMDGVYGPGEIDILASSINASDTSLTTSLPARFRVGEFLEIGDEIMRIIGINGKILTVLRGQRDTVAASHSANDIISVAPRHTRKEILDSIGEEIRSWPNSLFQEATSTFTVSTTDDVFIYDPIGVAGADDDFIRPLELIAYPDDGEGAVLYPRFDIDIGHPTFTSGIALSLKEKRSGYTTYRLTYAKHFNTSNMTTSTNLTADVGITESMEEIIYYGVLARVIVGRETRSVERYAQGQPRRASEVRPGAVIRSAAGFRQFRQQAIEAEKARLLRRWPIKIRR